MHLIDTNILLKYPSVLNSYDDIKINIRCIEEVDGLKKNFNEEVAYQARRASHKILQHLDEINFNLDRDNSLSVDDNLVEIAKEQDDILISNDLNVQIKCRANGVKYSGYDKIETNYTGVRYLVEDFDDTLYNEEVAKYINTKVPPFKMFENEFLIIKNKNKPIKSADKEDYETVCTLVYRNGKLEVLKNYGFKSTYVTKVSPRNNEQNCLLSLLERDDISIVLAAGTFGTGKSYLLTTYALQQLAEGKIDKIVYVPNNSASEDARELGILPGEIVDKELSYMGPIIDLIGEDDARMKIERGMIEVVPMAIMRGRSFQNSIIIVNEAQNLTANHVKLLVARCGEGTKIFFDGDIKQADSSLFRNKSGLKLLLHLKDSPIFSKIFGTVRLVTIERSLTAQASAYLDELLI